MNHGHRHKIALVLLLIAFSAPGIISYYVYQHPQRFFQQTTNKGEFVKPPIQLSAWTSKKWQLILWQPRQCNKICLEQIDKLVRVRLALGRQFYDVDVRILLPNGIPMLNERAQQLFADQQIQTNQLATSLSSEPVIYIADPAHYLILKYAATAQPDDIFHDLKRLVKKG